MNYLPVWAVFFFGWSLLLDGFFRSFAGVVERTTTPMHQLIKANRKSLWSITLLLFTLCTAYGQQPRFYDVDNGLSSSYITSVVQDREGYIWVATEDGLNRFDGHRFVTFRNIPGDSTSLINNHIRRVYEDSRGHLWIATLTGLCIYDKETDRFHPLRVPHIDKEKEITQFYYLTEDHQGYIWACISANGVVRISPETNECIYFNTLNSGICSDHINVIYEDRFGNLWFGSGQEGLSVYNPENGTFRTFRYHPDNRNGITSNVISSICEDMDGNVWIGSLTGGICIYSFATQSFRPFQENIRKVNYLWRDSQRNIWIGTMGTGFRVYSTTQGKLLERPVSSSEIDISDTKVQDMCEDKQGNIWMGFFQKGLFMIPSEKSFFTNYHFNPFAKEPTIGEGAVQPLFMDSRKHIWLGVDGKGVYQLDQDYRIIRHYGEGDESRLFNNVALSMFEDSKGYLWIGTFLDGAIRYNLQTNTFDLRLPKGEAPHGLLASHVNDIKEDADGRIWFGTNGGGINIYTPATRTFDYLVRDESKGSQNQLIDNYCSILCFDVNGIWWFGTYRGLCSYDPAKQLFTYYTLKNGKLPNDIVTCLKADKAGNLWVGTRGGLVCLDKAREIKRTYAITDGLPNIIINGIEEDQEGNLWIVTNNGLSMLDTARDAFVNYTTADGLYTNEFIRNALVKTSSGRFLVGSMKGITSFRPEEKSDKVSEPLNLLLTNLYIFNEKVEIGDLQHVLSRSLDYSDRIVLNHAQNSFSIEFAAIEYISPQKVQYEVMMEGFDKQWRSVKNNMVTYTNLSAGEYTLHIRSWMNNKENALTRTLVIESLPPFWATIWAKMIYILLFLIIAYMAYRYINDRMAVRRQEQLMQAKLQFFTDISHEIRTPLTLILSPLSKLISKNKDASLLQTYNIMYSNGIRLLHLVNQVMDLRALEFGKKTLRVEEVNITTFVRELKNSFNHLAEEKNLSFTFQSTPEDIQGYVDTDIMTKILFNLISNAFKYTEQGGVELVLSTVRQGASDVLAVMVSDTGKGIPQDQQARIFERFYMIGEESSRRANSSGIGLHLTRKLVELHHGSIELESADRKGSSFTVCVPYRRENFARNEVIEGNTLSGIPERSLLADNIPDKQPLRKNSKPAYNTTLLIVEDNPDIRELLYAEFEREYQILEAHDGMEGLHLAMERKPNLIISDILMPKMDGYEFCRKVRNNEQTATIPFIMLTAKSGIEQQIEGLEQGADAYIVKPFHMQYLRVTVERLLQRHLQSSRKQQQPEENTPPAESADEKLLQKLNACIDKWLDNPELSVETLCDELGLSRTHLNRKIKEVTGESPASYIRQLRLRKSARMMKERNLTVSEIAYMVGFSSPSYFCQAFRDYFGVTPKEYIQAELSPAGKTDAPSSSSEPTV